VCLGVKALEKLIVLLKQLEAEDCLTGLETKPA
jgi:hypothetical protein